AARRGAAVRQIAEAGDNVRRLADTWHRAARLFAHLAGRARSRYVSLLNVTLEVYRFIVRREDLPAGLVRLDCLASVSEHLLMPCLFSLVMYPSGWRPLFGAFGMYQNRPGCASI